MSDSLVEIRLNSIFFCCSFMPKFCLCISTFSGGKMIFVEIPLGLTKEKIVNLYKTALVENPSVKLVVLGEVLSLLISVVFVLSGSRYFASFAQTQSAVVLRFAFLFRNSSLCVANTMFLSTSTARTHLARSRSTWMCWGLTFLQVKSNLTCSFRVMA